MRVNTAPAIAWILVVLKIGIFKSFSLMINGNSVHPKTTPSAPRFTKDLITLITNSLDLEVIFPYVNSF